METANLLQNGQHQAVHLLKEFRFEDGHMFDRRSGNAVVLILAKSSGDTQIHNLDKYSDDFMTERKQLKMQSGSLFDEDGRVMMSRSEA